MFDRFHGKIISVKDQAITLLVGHFEFFITIPQESSLLPDQHITIWVHMHWNQEQGPSLFGFLTELDRTVFLLITSCSGVGPKIALSLLKNLGAVGALRVINDQNHEALSKVNGIGPKKAEQIIVQLKRNVATLLKEGIDLGEETITSHWHTVEEVLTSLHYTKQEIQQVLTHLKKDSANQTLSFDQLLRNALSFLSKKP